MITKQLKLLACGVLVLATTFVNAETPAEVKLIAAFEEDRGWCLDLRGGQNNGVPIGGLHGHTCYTYHGNGPTPDQAFIAENILEKNEFRLAHFEDLCMTLYEPLAGSFLSLETCDGRKAQQFVLTESGHIKSGAIPEYCLTIGRSVIPGGGGRPLHIMRDLTFEACDGAYNDRQTWELRSEWTGPAETTAERPYASNPNAPPPGGGGGGGAGRGREQ
ncbi:MAG: hypothetical protein ACR2QT_03280 [Woeseiaceae bacterium]